MKQLFLALTFAAASALSVAPAAATNLADGACVFPRHVKTTSQYKGCTEKIRRKTTSQRTLDAAPGVLLAGDAPPPDAPPKDHRDFIGGPKKPPISDKRPKPQQ